MTRDVNQDAIKVSAALWRAVKKLAKKQGVRSPPRTWVDNQVKMHLKGGSQHSPELLAKELLADWHEIRLKDDAAPMMAPAGPGAASSLALAVTFKPFLEGFRRAVWGRAAPPFTSESAAGLWLELMHRVELEASGAYLALPDAEMVPTFNLDIPDARRQSWAVPSNGILEKLYLLCAALSKASGWWAVDDVLKLVLLNRLPSAIRVQTSGAGNLTREMTITINGPVTEEELLEAYRQACKKTHIAPQSLSQIHFRLLFLVHYLMPRASWPKRFRQWLEWREKKEDETLPTYGAKIKEDGALENAGGYRNLRREYQRAMDRQSWTGKVPKLLRLDKSGALPEQALYPVTVPPAPWEAPNFDTSGFEPPRVDLDKLEALCQEAAKIDPYPHGLNTFWEWLGSE